MFDSVPVSGLNDTAFDATIDPAAHPAIDETFDASFDTRSVRGALGALAGSDVRACDDTTLLAAATNLTEIISFAQTAHAHVLAELETRGTTDIRYGMRTANWVAATTQSSRGPILGRLHVGRRLRSHFDVLDEAACAGELSFDHLKALCDTTNLRNVDALVDVQPEIIAFAKGATFDQYKRDVTTLAQLADSDGTQPDDLSINTLSMPVTIDNTVHLDGTFTREHGLAIRHAINQKANELFRRYTRDAEQSPDLEIPGRATLRALALAELLRSAIGAKPGAGSAPRAEITLIARNHEMCDVEGEPVPQAAADVWGCDPEMWAVVVNNMGIPVDVGHTKRLATVAQRHAITIRDGGCTFPGCDAPINWCDFHHITPWQHGGKTDQTNLVALCRHHHSITHRNGWTMHLDNNQIPHWTTPSGQPLTGQRHHRQC